MRLIDADALKQQIPSIEDEYKYVLRLIDEAPTVDAVPVIRCKDCKAWDREKQNGRGGCFCWNTDAFTGSQDFCSSGARRDGK